jgi:hypothetical protein
MRQVLTVVAVIIGSGIALNVSPHDAVAGPIPAVSPPAVAQAVIKKAGYWKRRWRYGYGPDVVVPDADVGVDVTAPDAATLNPPIVAIVPVRPVSCGQYHYWDGERCVDARYNNPYVGPS